MKPHHLIIIILLAIVCCSCRTSKRIESVTADTMRTEQTFSLSTTAHDSSRVEATTHDEHYAYMVERITIDSTGKVIHRDITRGTLHARKADTTALRHTDTQTIADSTREANESHAAKKEQRTTTASTSVLDRITALAVLTLIIAVVFMGVRLVRKAKSL